MRTHLKKFTQLLSSIFFTILLLTSCNESGPVSSPKPIAQDFSIQTLDGSTFKLSDYKDQSVLIVFWATWCPYCKKLLPGIERLHNQYSTQGLKVIAITIMEDGDPAAYVAQYGYTFTVGLDGDFLTKDYKVPGTPTLALLTKNNRWFKHLRTSDPESPELEQAIRASLGLDSIPD